MLVVCMDTGGTWVDASQIEFDIALRREKDVAAAVVAIRDAVGCIRDVLLRRKRPTSRRQKSTYHISASEKRESD